MIKNEELRLGNYILADGKIGYVSTLLPCFCQVNDHTKVEYGLSDIEPIPLTEAVLMAAGFQLFPEGYYFNFGCVVYKDFIRDGSGRWDGFTCNHSLRPLKGLHDLQNVFYFLRGKELEINMEELKKAVNG